VTSAVVCARQELDFSHIDVPTPPLRDPEIRRVDGSVQQQLAKCQYC